MTEIIKRNCKKHGFTAFKHKKGISKGKYKEWWACELCLKASWRKAQNKRRKIPEVKNYQSNFNKELNNIRRHLSVYLNMILIASNIKPE